MVSLYEKWSRSTVLQFVGIVAASWVLPILLAGLIIRGMR